MTIQQLIRWQSTQVQKAGEYTPFLSGFFEWPNQLSYVVDMHTGEIVESTGNFYGIFGYRREEIKAVPQMYEPIIKTNTADVVKCKRIAIEWGLNDGKEDLSNSYAQYGYRLRHRSGKIIRVLKQASLLQAPDGSITHSVATFTDVTHIDSRSVVTMKGFGRYGYLLDACNPEVSKFRDVLSPREIEILQLIARGKSSRDISQLLNLSRHTVDTHRRNMIRKLEVTNSIGLISVAREMRLL